MRNNIYRTILTAFVFLIAITFSPPLYATETANGDAFENSSNDYKIGAGDVLEILVWKEADLSKEVFVRLDGKITVPLLDDIMAAGKTPLELKNEIQNGLEKFVEGPFVTVTLKNPVSQKFYILGQVAQTGEYPLSKRLTAMQAFALAGGFTEWAQKDEILVFRNENGKNHTIRIDYNEIVKRKAEDDVIIQANDTIIVP